MLSYIRSEVLSTDETLGPSHGSAQALPPHVTDELSTSAVRDNICFICLLFDRGVLDAIGTYLAIGRSCTTESDNMA
jgi:hypothetical protein